MTIRSTCASTADGASVSGNGASLFEDTVASSSYRSSPTQMGSRSVAMNDKLAAMASSSLSNTFKTATANAYTFPVSSASSPFKFPSPFSSFPDTALSSSFLNFGKSPIVPMINIAATPRDTARAFASSSISNTHQKMPLTSVINNNSRTDFDKPNDNSDEKQDLVGNDKLSISTIGINTADGNADSTLMELYNHIDYNDIDNSDENTALEEQSTFLDLPLPIVDEPISIINNRNVTVYPSPNLSHIFKLQPDASSSSSSSSSPLNAVCGVSRKGLWAQGREHDDGMRGQNDITGKKKLSLKILGGQEAERGQWPWQVVILNRYKVSTENPRILNFYKLTHIINHL